MELLGVKLGFLRSRCRAVVSDVLCVRLYVHFVCVCVYMFMCVCVRTCIYDKSGYYGPRGEMFWNEQKRQKVFTYSPKNSMTGLKEELRALVQNNVNQLAQSDPSLGEWVEENGTLKVLEVVLLRPLQDLWAGKKFCPQRPSQQRARRQSDE